MIYPRHALRVDVHVRDMCLACVGVCDMRAPRVRACVMRARVARASVCVMCAYWTVCWPRVSAFCAYSMHAHTCSIRSRLLAWLPIAAAAGSLEPDAEESLGEEK